MNGAEVMERLSQALPLGGGAFDGYLELHVGSGPEGGRDILRWNDTSRGLAADALCEPYRAFPAPGGLLWWASTEQESRFAWLTDGPDPDRWPVLATDETGEEWDRRDVSMAEYVYRMLTEPEWPFSTAKYFDAHWFLSYDQSIGP